MENNFMVEWRKYMKKKTQLDDESIQEMEDHIVDTAESIQNVGLSEEESYIVALKRMGSRSDTVDALKKIHTERFYKNLFEPERNKTDIREIVIIAFLSLTAGLSSRFALLAGGEEEIFLLKNLSFFFIPFIAFLFIIQRKKVSLSELPLLLFSLLGFAAINFFPAYEPFHSRLIMSLHLPLLLWFWLIPVFRGKLNSQKPDMAVHFLKFTGETFLYSVLVGLGFCVFILLGGALLEFAGINSESFMMKWLFPVAFFTTPVVAAWLAEKKRNIIENLAPVLAKIFIPLFTILIITFIVVTIVTHGFYIEDRNFLIVFDLVLMLVVAMSFYEISSREETVSPGFSDYLNFSLILVVLLADLFALGNILARLSDFGFTINRVAALAENILMAVNLAGVAFIYIRFFSGKDKYTRLINWQGHYLSIYRIWFAIAVFLLPLLFQFQ